MPALLDKMREGRKSPQVLRIKLMAMRSKSAERLVFFFEGLDDIPVYENWISRLDGNLNYEPVPGNGKEQLLALQMILESDGELDRVYFFVDHDFDADENYANVYVLDAYSIESLLCNKSVVESILIDEFRCAGAPEERARVLGAFSSLLGEFAVATRELHESLFVARREGIRVNSSPDHVKEFLRIELTNVAPTYEQLSDVLDVTIELDAGRHSALKDEFAALSFVRAHKGKYVLQAFRLWLKALADDRKAERPVLFKASMAGLPGSPDQVTLRRLASATAPPTGLADFIGMIQ